MAQKKDQNTNIAMCLPTYCEYLNKNEGFNIIDIYPCRFGATCRGGHTLSQIKIKSEISNFKKKNLKDFNLLARHKNILSVLIQDSSQIKASEWYDPIKLSTSNKREIDSYTFRELATFWRRVTCYHRSTAKLLPHSKAFNSDNQVMKNGYKYKDSVPMFFLEDEDDMWPFERTLLLCPVYINMISNRHTKLTAKEICIGSINCKDGEHDIENIACEDDYMNGKCKCSSKEEIEEKRREYDTKIKAIEVDLSNTIDSEGFQIKITPKMRKEKEDMKMQLIQDKNSLYRLVHYTEQGLIPYNVRLANEKKLVKETEEKQTVKKAFVPVKKQVY